MALLLHQYMTEGFIFIDTYPRNESDGNLRQFVDCIENSENNDCLDVADEIFLLIGQKYPDL